LKIFNPVILEKLGRGKMKSLYVSKPLLLSICFILLCPFSALGGRSKSKTKGGPPPHAPAHGYRAKYNYHYYPKAKVYFDTSRRLYFYMEGDKWRASVSLPLNLNLKLGDYVNIEMDSDKPYLKD
jgi:hypothetical protein